MPPDTVVGVRWCARGFGLDKGVTMSKDSQSEPVKTSHRMRSFLIYVALLHVAFLLGFIPMWLRSCKCSCRLSRAEQE